MSTGARVLNFTGRQKIERKDVEISVSDPKYPEPPVISVKLDLNPYSYTLPPEGRVFVEAYRQTAWQRFDYGTVANFTGPEDRRLVDFGTSDGVHYRVKIVEASANGEGKARILAQADNLNANRENRARSLLCLYPDPELKDEVWKLVLPDGNDWPQIRVSTELVQDRHALGRSPEFLTLAMPEILRRILQAAIQEDRPEDDDEWNLPRGQWLRMALGIVKEKDLPEGIDGSEGDLDRRDDWVDRVVTRFCREHRLDRSFRKWWNEDLGSGSRGTT
jgi:hypothetical protein